MRRARWAALAATIALGAFVAIPAAPAGAQQANNTITVEKVVDGTAPEGTVFAVEVDCDSAEGPTTVYFDENGDPSDQNGDSDPGSNVVDVDPFNDTDVCTVTETEDGGASSVSYSCDDENSLRTDCNADNEVEFDDVDDATATVTVTNAFEVVPTTTTTTVAPQPVAPAPAPVKAAANFTG